MYIVLLIQLIQEAYYYWCRGTEWYYNDLTL